MPITKRDIERILSNMDEDVRKMFVTLEREEQLLIIFSMESSNSNRLALVEKRHIEFEEELRQYRKNREQRESEHHQSIEDTTEKIRLAIKDAMGQRFDWGIYFRDKILPTILTAISLGILYLVFGGKP